MSAHHYKCPDVNFRVFDVVSSVNKESVDLEYPISIKKTLKNKQQLRMSTHHYKCTDVNFRVFDVVSSINKECVDLE